MWDRARRVLLLSSLIVGVAISGCPELLAGSDCTASKSDEGHDEAAALSRASATKVQ